ncbi:MAG: hypothetical protein A2W11_06290 [Ignavibacteria bacterium RBG_16_35_7]|nr:MAG: hypothetical protein A2W11_06290 [Ignavibacteria bacterium RBG_16_35_7]
MLHGTIYNHSGEKLYWMKFCLIIISLALVSIQIHPQPGWTQKANILTPRGLATASAVNGKIFLISGWDMTHGNYNTNEMYDPSINTWEPKTPMPTARGVTNSVVIDGIIYVIAGGYPTATKKLEAYNPITNEWTTKADLNFARINARAAVVNGIIYVFGGYPNTRSCESYNPITNTWSNFSNFPEPSGGVVSVAVYNDSIYVFGGGYYTGLKTVYVYNPQMDSWTKKSDMSGPRTVAQACLVNGKIYVIGGATRENYPTAAVEMYDPVTDTWYIKSNMPVPSAFLSCAVVNNKIYVFEGTSDWATGGIRTWEYDPALDPVNILVPVELTSFTASSSGKEVTLNWSTATELNNQVFEVQRKFGGNDFVTVGSVKGHGTTTSPNNYTYIDKLVDAGKYFYRLKQIDFGGQYEYSNVIEVDVRVLDKFTLEQNYPNPFNPTTTVGYVLQEKGNVKLTLLNAIGEEIAVLVNEEQDKGYHKVELDGSKLTSGVYFYQLRAGNFFETKKMILLR